MGKEFREELAEAMKKDLAAREAAKEELRRVSCGTMVKKRNAIEKTDEIVSIEN